MFQIAMMYKNIGLLSAGALVLSGLLGVGASVITNGFSIWLTFMSVISGLFGVGMAIAAVVMYVDSN